MKKLLAVIGIIILVVPTALAVLFYNNALVEESLREKLLRVEVTDEHGTLYEYTSESADEMKNAFDTLRSFNSVTEKSMSKKSDLVKLFENSALSEDNPKCSRFYIKYQTNHNEYSVELFITDKEGNGSYIAYLAIDEDNVVCFDDVAKKKLLTCKFTYSIYNNSRIPELTVGDRIVKYSSATWKVQTANGEFVDVPCNNGANAELEAFNAQFSFSQKPDAASVRVRDKNDAELYNADLAAFGSFTLARSGELTIDVTAFWYQQSDRSFYGTVTYTYTAYFTAEPRFEMNAYEAQPGGTLLLSCINIPESADIGAKIGERPVNLYRNGENVYAFVAFPYDTVPGQYSINITVADKVHKIAVTVTDKKFSTTAQIPVNMMPADRFSAAASEDAINEYRDLMKAIGAEKSGELRYDGTLLDYQLSFVLYKGYGLYMPYEAENKTLRNDGVLFTARVGSTVPSMGAGTVAAVGECAYLGKYVVVDHGYGLRTWYTSLDAVDVKVGDAVEKNGKLGTTGTGGISPEGTMLVMVTVDDIPVTPYVFWEGARMFAK
jgi:murein DD-endopeptidase MepM/ murein hydrolase activator NlpD